MVTRKTRVLSAIAAVLMLVSMFTCFVLPAVAEVTLAENPPVAWPAGWPENMIAFKDRGDSTATDFAITDAEDWMAAAYASEKESMTYAGITLWFTNDIDFSEITLSGTEPYKYFFNNYGKSGYLFSGTINGQGYAIKNMDVDLSWTHTNGNRAFLGLICYGSNATVRDLTVDSSCSFKYTTATYTDAGKTNPKEIQVGIFMGFGSGCAFINCRNEADFVFINAGNPKTVSSASPFGRQQGGVKLINCSNTGDITSTDEGRANGLTEWVNATAGTTIYNCYNSGKLVTGYVGDYDYTGVMSTSVKTGTSIDNIVVSNAYCVGDSFASGSRNVVELAKKGTSLEAGADKTGELAYLLNKNYTAYEGVARKYYTVKDGATVWGTEAEQPVKLNITLGAMTETVYAVADAEGKIDLTAVYPLEGGVYMVDGDEVENGILIATIGSEVDITATSTAKVYTYLQEKLDWFATETIEYYVDGEGNPLTKAFLDGIQAKINADSYEDQAAVDADLALLEGYVFNTDSIVSMSNFAKYPAASGYTVATKADMELVAENKAEFTAGQTLYITADIDMQGSEENMNENFSGLKAGIDGGGHTISNLWVADSLLGDYRDAEIKNLTFKDCGGVQRAAAASSRTAFLIQNTKGQVKLTNLTFDNVYSIADTESTDTGAMQGIVVACATGSEGDKLYLTNITVVNSTMARPQSAENSDSSSKYWNSAIVVGKSYWGQVYADGIYLNNNTITGKRTGGGTGIVFGELVSTATIKNVAVLNTTADPDTLKGVLFGMYKDHGSSYETNPVGTFENIIAYNNGGEPVLIVTDATNEAETINVSNVYTDATTLQSAELATLTATNCNLDAAEAVKSGAAAYELNAKGAKLLAMDGTTPIFAGANDKAPVAVTFKALDGILKDVEAPIATYTLYTDKDGKLLGLTQDLLDAASWDNEAGLADAVFGAEAAVIGYTAPAHDHQYAYADNGDGTHTATCTFYHEDDELGVLKCNHKEIAEHETEKKNVTDTNTEEAAATHQVVDACKHCDYESDDATDCTGTTSISDEESWEASCAGAGQTTTVCDACDYKHVKVLAQLPHSWGDWTQVGDTDTHKRSCANAAVCQVADEVEPCDFGDDGICECGNKAPVFVELDSNVGVVGEELEVNVDLKSNTAKLAGVTLEITYDADILTLKGAEDGKWDVVFDDQFPAASGKTTTKLALVSAANMEGDGTLLKLIFDVKDDETLANTATEIEVNVAEAKDENLQAVEFKGDSIIVELRTSMMKGDINGDQLVNMVDAILLLRYVSGTELPEGMQNAISVDIADLTDEGDGVDLGEGQVTGEINVNDVIYLLRYLNGWIVEL